MRQHLCYLVLALALSPMGALAEAYLNWTASDLINNEYNESASSVVLYMSLDGNDTELATVAKSDVEASLGEWFEFYDNKILPENSSSASFYVTAYNGSDVLFDGKTGNIISYADLVDSGAISDFMLNPNATEYWAPKLSPVPEPSGGLLMLIGCAALALRRRRERERRT